MKKIKQIYNLTNINNLTNLNTNLNKYPLPKYYSNLSFKLHTSVEAITAVAVATGTATGAQEQQTSLDQH